MTMLLINQTYNKPNNIKLSYPLDARAFKSNEHFNEALQFVKSKQFTVTDIKLLIELDIKRLYNDLVSSFFGCNPVNTNSIFKRYIVEETIKEYHSYKSHLFPFLLQNGLMSVCGRGYVFNYDKFEHDEDEHNKYIELVFFKGLTI